MASGWCGARIGIAAWASATPCGAALFVAWLFVATMGAAIAPTSGARAQEDASPAASEPGATDAWFVYETTRTVGQGTGAYAGYSDGLRAAGRYDLRAEGGTLSIAASYAWTYQGETCDDGRVDRVVTADFTTRLYTGNTDLDDYDGRVGATPLATWTWIPPTTAPGFTKTPKLRTAGPRASRSDPGAREVVLRRTSVKLSHGLVGSRAEAPLPVPSRSVPPSP